MQFEVEMYAIIHKRSCTFTSAMSRRSRVRMDVAPIPGGLYSTPGQAELALETRVTPIRPSGAFAEAVAERFHGHRNVSFVREEFAVVAVKILYDVDLRPFTHAPHEE